MYVTAKQYWHKAVKYKQHSNMCFGVIKILKTVVEVGQTRGQRNRAREK